MKKLALAVMVGMMASPAVAVDWRETNSTNQTMQFVDKDSIHRVGETVTFWEFDVLKTRFQGSDNMRNFLQADCGDKSYQILQASLYNGRTFLRDYPRDSMTRYASPDSLLFNELSKVCDISKLDEFHVSDPLSYAKAFLDPVPHIKMK